MSEADVRKAAILLAALPCEQADALLAGLDADQAERVLDAMSDVGPVSGDELESVFFEFARRDASLLAARGAGGPTIDRSVASRTSAHEPSPFAAVRPLHRARPASSQSYAFLGGIDGPALALLLADERPQTIALIASHIPPALGAELVASLAPSQQVAVVRAVAATEPTDPAIVDEVADVLRQRIAALAAA